MLKVFFNAHLGVRAVLSKPDSVNAGLGASALESADIVATNSRLNVHGPKC